MQLLVVILFEGRIEMRNGLFELVPATLIAETDDRTAVGCQRVGGHRFPGPRANVVDAISNVQSWHSSTPLVCAGLF